MFTGIIENVGIFEGKREREFEFKAHFSFTRKLKKGISIAVNGVCLTVVRSAESLFTIDVMPETLKKTMLGNLKSGNLVNLELPATLKTFLSGHIVQGHVDGVGRISSIKKDKNSKIFSIAVSKYLMRYIVEKGSIAVNGISLTVIGVFGDSFTVGIIPYTLEHTMVKESKVGDLVNIEVDILAKYIKKLASYEKK